MASDISAALRRQIAERDNFRCEYCLMPESELLAGCEVDHVISRKHGGLSDLANLALSCERCNRAKGTDVGSITAAGKFIRLYNPRIDLWPEHFRLDAGKIVSISEVGSATVILLKFNAPDRILQRQALQQVGIYPAA
jgi:hypothetical protein